ncbi:VOC family protein [Acetobacter oryzoeni]|uniref:VOC family protein n=1 Tax=Acetobacter oryzoeni TaxID=2500548 RepID=A0A5B9GJ71_9PROT|nr:VOC family protein [Acetobacter oryzoeni]QEE86262.1 VOC family protein [Acetobacter oryzoeni]
MREHPVFPTGFAVDHVVLTVNDPEKVAAFYQKTVGLEGHGRDGETMRLGAGGTSLLELRQDRHARLRSSREAGLFHTAFLLPSRSALACWLDHVIEQKLPVVGASNHDVSEAVYLSDPEGNGVEIYADRPASTWIWQDGTVRMSTAALDIPALLGQARGARWDGAPHGTRVGHVHLQVGTIEAAEDFYARKFGLDITCRYPGGTFYAADGYHHHIATNIWNSRGAGQHRFPSTGLAEIALSDFRPPAAGLTSVPGSNPSTNEVTVADPWGTPIRLHTPEAL